MRKKGFGVFVLLALAAFPSPTLGQIQAYSISITQDKIVIQTQTVSLILSIPGKGSIINIANPMTNQFIRLNQSVPNFLWLVDTFNGYISSNDAQQFTYSTTQEKSSSDLELYWQSSSLTANAMIKAESSGMISMKLNVSNLDPHVELQRVFFPYIGGIEQIGASPENDMLAVPHNGGILYKNATDTLVKTSPGYTYPGTLSMQFVYYYETGVGGFYIAAYDNESNYKGIELFADSKNSFKLDWYHYAANIVPGNSFVMDYPVVLEGVKGYDWQAAAQIYKSWALKQWYVSSGPLITRGDVPEWLKGLNLVWKGHSYVTNATTGQVILAGDHITNLPNFANDVKKLVGNRSVYIEWWGWNRDGFDRGYPEYYPPRDGEGTLIDAVNKTHALGMKVGLYFNGRLVDITTQTYNKSKPYLTVDNNGNYYTETYNSGWLKGAIPAPSTDWWRQQVINFTTKALSDYKIDMVFLDQMTVAPPVLDMSAQHNHQPGGGSWWWRSVASILNSVRASIRQHNGNTAVSSEGVSEVYIPDVDAFAMWNSGDEFRSNTIDVIPLFSFVYHGYALILGNYHQPPDASANFYQGISDDLSRGLVPGVFTNVSPSTFWPNINLSIGFVRSAAVLESAFSEFLKFGKMIETPNLTASSVEFYSPYSWAVPKRLTSVASGAYSSKDGRVGIFLSNRTNQTQSVLMFLNFTRLGISGSQALEAQYDANGNPLFKKVVNTGDSLALDVPSYSNIAVVLDSSWVVVDKAHASNNRVDVNSNVTLNFHFIWGTNSTTASGINASVGRTWHVSNATGWVTLQESSGTVGDRRFAVEKVASEVGEREYLSEVNSIKVIWDRVKIVLSAISSVVSVGANATILASGRYEYDGTPFKGKIVLNDTTSKDISGVYGYTVSKIEDEQFGLTAFTSNAVSIEFVRISTSTTTSIISSTSSTTSISYSTTTTSWLRTTSGPTSSSGPTSTNSNVVTTATSEVATASPLTASMALGITALVVVVVAVAFLIRRRARL